MPRRSETRRPASRRLLARLADERLVALVRRGNEPAFEELFDRHSGGVLSFCTRMLSSREEGEDALQHVFLAVYQAIAERSFNPRAFKPWLYTIARNRCFSVLRSRLEVALPGDEESVTGTDQTADFVEQRAEMRELLSDVRNLPVPQREALLLSELGDLSHAQIAQVIDCPRAKVKSLVFQARASLSLGREAREVPCSQIREKLAGSPGLRLSIATRRHLKTCEACSEFASEVRRRQQLIAIALPVAPSIGLKRSVLATVSWGGGAGGRCLATGLLAKGASKSRASACVGGGPAGKGLSIALTAKAGLLVAGTVGVTALSLAGAGLIEESPRAQDSGHRTSANESRADAAERQTPLLYVALPQHDGRAHAERRQHPDRPNEAPPTSQHAATTLASVLAHQGGSLAVPPARGGQVSDLGGVGQLVSDLGAAGQPAPDLGGVGQLVSDLGAAGEPIPDPGAAAEPAPDPGAAAEPAPDPGAAAGPIPDLGAGGEPSPGVVGGR